jgi:anaerobic dimethyl sulfoxide reductase subunit A
MKEFPVFCGKDCGGDACPLLAKVEGGRVTGLRANTVAGKGILPCAKGYTLGDYHYSPHALKKPLLRVGERGSGRFQEIPFDEAIEIASEGLRRIRDSFGPQSIMDLSSAGSTGALHNTGQLCRRFLNLLGGCTKLDGSYSSNAAKHALTKVFGTDFQSSGFDPEDALHANAIVLWGANILEARLGAQLSYYILKAKMKGVPVVCIDPRRTLTTQALGAWWLSIRPGTDCALMYSLIYLLEKEGRIDHAYLAARARGYDNLLGHCLGLDDGTPKTPEWAGKVCGIYAEDILRLYSHWRDSRPLMLIPGYSIQRTAWGEEAMRLSVFLQLASGNFSLRGGSTGSLNNRSPRPRVGRMECGDETSNRSIPISLWPDAILDDATMEPFPIKAVYVAGGNFLNQGGDIQKNVAAFKKLDFAVCNENFLTPTAKYCDVVFPVASPLQKEDIGIPWDGSYLLYKPKILPFEAQERSDFEIFSCLATRLGFEAAYTEGLNESQWIDRFIDQSEIQDREVFKRQGFYCNLIKSKRKHVAFDQDPISCPMGTPSGKLEFDSPEATRWLEGDWEAYTDGYPLLLVTPKKMERVHSQAGIDPAAARENTITAHPRTAEALGVKEGDKVRLTSANGTGYASLTISSEIHPEVVSIFEGSWFDPNGHGGSPNLFTSSLGTRESASCVMHGIPVRMEKY